MAVVWKVEAQLGTSGAWTEITDYVFDLRTSRGAASDLNQPDAGTCMLVLDNRDGRFTPDNTAGAYSPNVILGCGFRVTVTANATEYTVYRGHAERWSPSWNLSGRDTVEVVCEDGLGWFANKRWEYPWRHAATQFFDPKPYGYWPLQDGANVVADLSGNSRNGSWTIGPNVSVRSDTVVAGAESAVKFSPSHRRRGATLPYLPTTSGTSGTWGVAFALRFDPAADLFTDPGWSVEVLSVDVSYPYSYGSLQRALQVSVNADGDIVVVWDRASDGTTYVAATIEAGMQDGRTHSVWIRPASRQLKVTIDGNDEELFNWVAADDAIESDSTYQLRVGNTVSNPAVTDAVGDLWMSDLTVWDDTTGLTTNHDGNQVGRILAGWRDVDAAQMVEDVADQFDWADRTLGGGDGVGSVSDKVVASAAGSTSPLELMRELASSVGGFLYVDEFGTLWLDDRNKLWETASYNVSQQTFTDDGTDEGYASLRWDLDTANVINVAVVEDTAGCYGVASNDTSITAYGEYRRQFVSMEAGVCQEHAEWIVHTHGTPALRTDELELSVHTDEDLAEAVVGLSLFQIVTVERTQHTGDDLVADMRIAKVTHRVSDGGKRWDCVLSLVPFELPALYGTGLYDTAGDVYGY